jgi:NitT/TauT family transport system permease protein
MSALRTGLVALLSSLLVLLLWQGLIMALHVPHYIVPAPDAILHAAIKNNHILLAQAGFTLRASASGLVVSLLCAVIVATGFTRSRRLARAAMPAVIVFRSAPVPAIAPLATLFLGRGIGTSILVVSIVSFFPLLVSLMRGLAAIDRNASELFHLYSANFWQGLFWLRLPTALPYLFSGLRIAAATALLGAMLSEWITGSRGLGNLILESADMRETELMWAAVLVSVAIALAAFWLTSAAERAATRWKS